MEPYKIAEYVTELREKGIKLEFGIGIYNAWIHYRDADKEGFGRVARFLQYKTEQEVNYNPDIKQIRVLLK